MNKITFGFFAVILYFAVVTKEMGYYHSTPIQSLWNIGIRESRTYCGLWHSYESGLKCYNCDLGLCIGFKTEKICDAGELCFSGVGKAASVLDIKMKGCLIVSKCNTTEDVNSNSALYKMTKTCCSTDLCNSALGHFHFSAVSMAFTTITSVFIVKILI